MAEHVLIVNRQVLAEFGEKHSDVRGVLDAWVCEVEAARWTTSKDAATRYPSASFLAGNRVVFNLKGNKYRLDVQVNYASGVVLIKRAGTHAEYSKWKF